MSRIDELMIELFFRLEQKEKVGEYESKSNEAVGKPN